MRIGLTVRETGWLLGLSEPQVRRLLASGRLEWAVSPTRVSPPDVARMFPDDALARLRHAAMLAILEGRLQVPIPATRYAKPVSLRHVVDLLDEANTQ